MNAAQAAAVTAARDFLADIKHHPIDSMPRTLMVREIGELRRRLGQVLDITAAHPAGPLLDPGQLATVLRALADAATDCLDRAGRDCRACEAHPAGLCEAHAADLDAAQAYQALERDLASHAGPFATEREARAAAHQRVSPEPGWSILRAAGNRELLRQALDAAGVEMGAHDERIAAWVASWEDSTVATVAGWISRANRAGSAPVLDSEAWTCRDCGGQMIGKRTPDDLCASCIGLRLAVPHSAESQDQAGGDDERCCPDCDGNPHHLAGGCQDAAEGGQR